MPTRRASSDTGRTTPEGRGAFRPRQLKLADGGSLVITASGSIDQRSDDGTTTHSWAPDDPDWARQALRFGIQPQSATVAPHGRSRATRPRRW